MAYWLPDVFGPDGVRVTFRITTSTERLLATWRDISPLFATRARVDIRPLRSRLPTRNALYFVQTRVFSDRHILIVEADDYRPMRLPTVGREAAEALAAAISASVKADGVAALERWKPAK